MISCWTRILLSGVAFFGFPCFSAAETAHRGHDPDKGMEGSIRLGIPEPMVFDLVRPLGAARGEFEVNSLFQYAPRRGPLLWAPEIEFAFTRATTIEFELPMAGTAIEDYKVALQQKLPARQSKRYTHGLQGIGEVASRDSHWQASGLYIAGVRWHERWSTLSMAGFSRTCKGGESSTAPLLNHSLFHERWKRTALGVEWNSKNPLRTRREWLLMPQVHFRIVEKINLQFGSGYSRRAGQAAPVIGWRLIREL